jgi:hypothetical protein
MLLENANLFSASGQKIHPYYHLIRGSPGYIVISLYYELLKEFYGKLFRLQTQ